MEEQPFELAQTRQEDDENMDISQTSEESMQQKRELIAIVIENGNVINEEITKEQSVLRSKIQVIPGGPHLIWMVDKIQDRNSNIDVTVQVQKYQDESVAKILKIIKQHLQQISQPSLGLPPDVKVRRGLGILEELILEKNPDFFKIQEAKKQATRPLGIPIANIMKRLPVQVRAMRSDDQIINQPLAIKQQVVQPSKPKVDVQMQEEELKDSEIKMLLSLSSASSNPNRSEDIKHFAQVQSPFQKEMMPSRVNNFDISKDTMVLNQSMDQSSISDSKMSIPEPRIPSLDRINQKSEFEIDESISIIANNEAQSGLIDEAQIKHPYTYQKKIVEKILFQWGLQEDNPESYLNQYKTFGSIIFIETGAGKSYISLMLIKSLFGEPHDHLAELTPEQLKEKRMNNCGNLLYDENEASKRKKVVFIVPTNNLVDQQSSVIERYTEKVRVGKFQGGKNNKKVYKYENWIQQFRDNDVFVFIARKFYDLLMHGYIKMDQIDLLILDEAHHTNQEHLYNLIMTDFYYSGYVPGLIKRPKILALTASPIKQKIEASKIYKHEIEEFLQSLADNLYSKFVSVSAQDLDEMRNECKIQVMTYESLFEFNSHTVKLIEQNLILKLLRLLEPENLPPQFYKVSGGASLGEDNNARGSLSLLRVLNQAMFDEFRRSQDTQILKFINTRKKFIDIEVDESKKIDLATFRNSEDRTLILVIIMLLKNINNLIVELGMFGLQMFLIDLRRDLLEKQSEKFRHKGKEIIEIFNYFIDEMLVKELGGHHNMYQQLLAEKRAQQVAGATDKGVQSTIKNSEVSGKVSELVRIMETEYEKNPKLKAIVFVKDRSVATYLKKILDFMFSNKQRNLRAEIDDPNLFSSSSLIADFQDQNQSNPEFMESAEQDGRFRCNFAIGFQGKSLTNKAYRSTKSIEDEINMLEEFLPQFSQVKMSHQNLMKNIDDFKNDKINILIATSVIEEGLDVSTCNLVVSINEVLNVKSFIQTKGRARQRNSKFIFLCAEEERNQVCETIEGFKKLISNIQEIAYSDGDKVILPNPNIIVQKQREPWQFLVTSPPFQAKCTMREAPTMLDLLCNEITDELTNSRLKESDLLPQNLIMSDQDCIEMQKVDQIRLKRKIEIKTEERVDAFKNRTFSTKLIMPEYLKYFFARSGGVVFSDKCFQKKKDSENYVSLLTVRRLYECGMYGDDLYPNLNKYLNAKIISEDNFVPVIQPKSLVIPHSEKLQNQQSAQRFIEELKLQQVPKQPQAPSQPTKTQISQQLMQAKQELQSQKEQYTRDAKKSSLPVPVHATFLNKNLSSKPQIDSPKIDQIMEQSSLVEEIKESFMVKEEEQVMSQSFYILVFQGVNSQIHSEVQTQSSFSLRRKLVDSQNQTNLDGQYPYRAGNEHIGILWDKNLSGDEYKLFIELQQENRQKQKNAYYLEKLCELNLISAEQKNSMVQMQDILEMRIETVQLEIQDAEQIQKLKFFHYWFFQYVNNANFRFYKKLLKREYTFTALFGSVLNFLLKAAKWQRKYIRHDFLESLFNIKDGLDTLFETQIDQTNPTLGQIGTFLVPILSTIDAAHHNNEGSSDMMIIDDGSIPPQKSFKYTINWTIIDELMDFVKTDLLSVFLTDNTDRSHILNKYDLAIPQPKIYENSKESHQDILREKIQHLWQCDSNQSVFILMSTIGSEDRIYQDSQPQIGTILRKNQSLNQSLASENGYNAGSSAILTSETDNEVNWCYKNISVHNYKSMPYLGVNLNKLGPKGIQFMRQENQTLAEHFFAKTGVYLTRKENPYLFKCSKERCLLDFSVQKSTIINTQAEENKNSQAPEKPPKSASASQQASTLFDVPQQLMRILPMKYEQYQLFQMSNFCYASLLEIIKVENFINKFFSDLQIHLENPSDQINLQQWHLTPRLHETSIQMTLSTFMKQDFMLMMEAMTAPTANKPIDYERLEFYGDSVISFLVILELFLTTATLDRNYKEGELDFERIKKVSNMNLAQTNENHRIYQFIITDSTKVIADELSPPGFKQHDYQLKVKSKSVNEIKSKLMYLKKCEVLINERISKKLYKNSFVDLDYVELVRMFLLQNDLTQIIQNFYPEAWQAYELEKKAVFVEWQQRRNTNSLADISAIAHTNSKLEESLDIFTLPYLAQGTSLRNLDLSWRVAERWFHKHDLSIDHLRLCVVQASIDKSESKCRKEQGKRQQAVNQQMAQLANSGGGKSKKKKVNEPNLQMKDGEVTEKMRHFQSKQLADTVESITGAVAQAAGLFSAQDLLHKLGVLKCSTSRYEEELNKFLSSNYFTGPGYFAIIGKYGDLFSELQDIVGYRFNNPCLLVQAMTHKSFKEHFNTMKDHQSHQDMRLDDYERLEFLGDSILNFLVAQYYFNQSKDTPLDFQPKQLHKLKTSVVNNVFLSLVLVQRGVHKFVLYNQISDQFKKQFEQYVDVVQGLLAKAIVKKEDENGDIQMEDGNDGEYIQSRAEELSDQEFGYINLEPLYEHSLKIFGDVFESLIGAIFLDSRSISKTEAILNSMLKPFLKTHTNVETLDDHSRTKLLELWNSKPYSRQFKIKHEVDQKNDGSAVFRGLINKIEVRRVTFQKDMKNKVRRFYNDFYDFVDAFIKQYEVKHGADSQHIDKELREYRKTYENLKKQNQQPAAASRKVYNLH